MKTIIMAGGKGTRIASVASDIPKPMIRICDKPILLRQIECLKKSGLTDITLVIGHLGHVIKEYFKDGKDFGVKISYFEETTPLGTAGALFKMMEKNELKDDFLLMCGDTILDIDFNRIISFHKQKNSLATLVSHPNSHPYDSSLLVTEILPPKIKGGLPEDTKKVIMWMNKEDERKWYKNRVNAGIEVISPKLLEITKKNFVPRHPENPDKIDLDRDVLKPNVGTGRIFAYDTPEYIKDMGTPDRFYQTEKDIISKTVENRNLSKKQKAIFLDRDGTLTKDVGFVRSPEQLELAEGAGDAIRKINNSGYLAILVTNQPVIARGDITFEELEEINRKLETLLGKDGAYLDAIYFCPHHTDKGFEGERIEYKCNCECRKPKPGMILNAAKDFNIDITKSFMIGDSKADIECGTNAGVSKSILIDENKNILDAVSEIIGN